MESNGTPAGTASVAELSVGSPGFGLDDLTAGPNGSAFFGAYDPVHDTQSWIYSPVGSASLYTTGGNDQFYFKDDPASDSLDIWQNSTTPGSGIPYESLALSGLSGLSITGATGTRSITMDTSAGDPFASLPLTLNGAAPFRCCHLMVATLRSP